MLLFVISALPALHPAIVAGVRPLAPILLCEPADGVLRLGVAIDDGSLVGIAIQRAGGRVESCERVAVPVEEPVAVPVVEEVEVLAGEDGSPLIAVLQVVVAEVVGATSRAKYDEAAEKLRSA